MNTTVSSYRTYHHSMLQIVAMAYFEDLTENSTSELRPTQSEISADQNMRYIIWMSSILIDVMEEPSVCTA